MPRNTNPGSLRVGTGKPSPGIRPDVDLTGAGMAGAGPNIGQVDAPVVDGDTGVLANVLSAHLRTPGGSHPARAIALDGHPSLYGSEDVEGALDEIQGILPLEPPTVGHRKPQMAFTGIPDWGRLKMADASLVARSLLASSNAPGDIFPYYHANPNPATDPEFTVPGADPATDPIWNSGVPFAGLEGAGAGEVYSGGFVRPTGGGPGALVETCRLLERDATIDGGTGLPVLMPVVVSGSLYPADRGVLALVHWPAGGDTAAFLAQDLLDRCVAAILLGRGISGDPCYGPGDTPLCDGDPGGIFGLGGLEAGNLYNPFAYPGRATGQYDLEEIVTGLSSIDGSALRAPWDDLDDDGNPGWVRTQNVNSPGPGQVRLGTDPQANNTLDAAPVLPYGIPVLGGTVNLYDPAPAGSVLGGTVLGSQNFFKYRLPYLGDYSAATGLRYTPRGVDATATKEAGRYFAASAPTQDFPLATPLTSAGGFTGFPGDYWTWQVARYRHTFRMPSTVVVTEPEDVGSYFLIHFKTEADFEKMVREGILPDDVANGYETYSAQVVSAGGVLDVSTNLVNEDTSAEESPRGPAPAYGLGGEGYHTSRANILLDPDASAFTGAGSTGTFTWTTTSVPGTEHVVWISGVAYFTPRNLTTGAKAFVLSDVTVNVPSFWEHSYRTDDKGLSGVLVDTDPALLDSPNPAFLGLAPFAFDLDLARNQGSNTAAITVGIPGTGLTESAYFERPQRIEFPYTHLGSNGGGVFGPANAPQALDDLDLTFPGATEIEFEGDVENPSFTVDAGLRLYLRQPVPHEAVDSAIMPFASTQGHGQALTSTVGAPATIFYHSTAFDESNLNGEFGNFLIGAAPALARPSLFTAVKNIRERFLDETYRYRSDWHADIGTIGAPYTAATPAHLIGPGMAGWNLGPVEVPVKAGRAPAGWDTSSYVQQGLHLDSLEDATPQEIELQVSGLPDRNPPLSDGVAVPFPSAGVLIYPKSDFNTDTRPTDGVDMTAAQPDYTGSSGIRSYVRCFDASIGGTEAVTGQPFFHVRIDGLLLQDFSYTAPGPGSGLSGIAVMVKIPGLTTWMDLGRADGSGPSKQDGALDGAGCKVVGVSTRNKIDPITGMVYCQVKVHAGPAASLFTSTGFGGSTAGEVPVLIKVVMTPTATLYDLTLQSTGIAGGFLAGARPGSSAVLVRGIVGLRIVPESLVETA